MSTYFYSSSYYSYYLWISFQSFVVITDIECLRLETDSLSSRDINSEQVP